MIGSLSTGGWEACASRQDVSRTAHTGIKAGSYAYLSMLFKPLRRFKWMHAVGASI